MGWIKTDSDQWCNKVDDRNYKFIQIVWLDTTEEDTKASDDLFDNYTVVAGFIDLDDYETDEKEIYISTYGYDSVDDVVEAYGKAANQIIAECIFEETCHYDSHTICDVVSHRKAEAIVKEYIYAAAQVNEGND